MASTHKKTRRTEYASYPYWAMYLRFARDVLGIDREELAREIGISVYSIRKWECDGLPKGGENRRRTLKKIGELLGTKRRSIVKKMISEIGLNSSEGE